MCIFNEFLITFIPPIVALRNIIPVQQTPKPSAQVPSWVPPILSHSCLKEYTLRHITLWRVNFINERIEIRTFVSN